MRFALILLSIFVFSSVAYSEEKNFMEFGTDEYESKSSRWEFDVAANYFEYPTKLPSYKGQHFSNASFENYEIYGSSIAFGRDFFINGGFSSTLKFGGFYYRTFDAEKGKASKDIDIELANTRTDHIVYGGNSSLSLNYLFEGTSIDTQPFILAGIGVGKARIEREYQYDGIESNGSDREYYEMEVEDDFSFRELGIGINFISKRGIVTSFKFAKTTIAINKRKLEGKMLKAGDDAIKLTSDEKNSQEYSVNTGSIAIGFLF